MPRRILAGALSLLVLGGLLAAAPAVGSPIDRDAFVETPVVRGDGVRSALVHVGADASLADGIRAARDAGLLIGTRYEEIKVFVAYGTPANFEALAGSDVIEALEANRKLKMHTETSHKATRGQDVLDGAITLPDGSTIDGSGIGVAVIDSGVDGTHPDLENRMGGNVKIVCTTPQPVVTSLTGFTTCLGPKAAVPLPDTDHTSAGGHGTHVAGTVAGDGTASGGKYHGAAPGAKLYGVSVGTALLVENALDGLDWVLQNHDQVAPAIRVANNSWGSGNAEYDPENAPFHKATWKLQDQLIAEGVTLVWAAGNSYGDGSESTIGGECVNPTPGLICVANYDDKNIGTRNGTIDASSSRGAANDPSDWPDVSAPGTQIVATCRLTLPVCNAHFAPDFEFPNHYAELSGTSMASPHVAGIVAQVLQANPSLTPAQIEDILEDTAYKFQWGAPYSPDPYNPDDTTSHEKGHGLVDVVAAITVALGGTPEPDPTPEPTGSPSPEPTHGPAPAATYFLHSGTSNNHLDRLSDIFTGTQLATFDSSTPTSTEDSIAIETPFRSSNGTAIYDVSWAGAVGGTITDLTIDFWHRTPRNAAQATAFGASIWVGTKEYRLPQFSVPAAAQPARATKEFTTTTVPDGNDPDTLPDEVPMSIAAGDETVWFQIWAPFANDAGTHVLFDSVSHPSGFSVNTKSGPTPNPTETTPQTVATQVSFTDASADSAQYSDDATIEALLTTEDGQPIADAELAFTMTGSAGATREWTSVTDGAGVASRAVNFRDEPGVYDITVRYLGVEDAYAPDADQTAFVVELEDSATVLEVVGKGSNQHLSATTTDADDAAGLSDLTIEFFADGNSLGTETTDESGSTVMDLPPKYRNGHHDYEAVFGGDSYYERSADRQQT